MSRFYAPKENVSEKEIFIDGNEAHHIIDVMRMADGDKVVVFDGTGNEYTGFIKNVDHKSKTLVVEVVRKAFPSLQKTPEVTLAQAMPKKGKMDYIVEKATELGVTTVVPILTDRTIVRPDKKSAGKKVDRWRSITIEAAKQCGRTSVPEVSDITQYKDLITDLDRYDLALMACLTDKTVSIKESLSGFVSGKVIVFIGPEGDFTPEEIQSADRDNCKAVSLGHRVLKSDTAGLFALSVLNYEFSL